MQMVEIPVQTVDSFPRLQNTDMPLERRMKVWAAISLYIDRQVSIGRAAELAGMGCSEFQQYLGQHEIPVSLVTIEELEDELNLLRKMGRLK